MDIFIDGLLICWLIVIDVWFWFLTSFCKYTCLELISSPTYLVVNISCRHATGMMTKKGHTPPSRTRAVAAVRIHEFL